MMSGSLQQPPLDRLALLKLDTAFVDLHDYWVGKCGARTMPSRSDIDPAELKSHLGSLLILDVVEPLENSRYRLVGTQIVQIAGRDATNRPIGELYSEPLLGWLLTLYRAIISTQVPHAGWGRWMLGNSFLNVRGL